MALYGWLRRAMWDAAPRDHWQGDRDFRRRQLIALVGLIAGGTVLAISLRIEPGNPWFYPATLALAGIWTVFAFLSGPLHMGRILSREAHDPTRPVIPPLVLGLALAGVFVVGALLVRLVPSLADQIRSVLAHANEGSAAIVLAVTVVNGIAEELFFRGALYAALPRYQVAITTVVYGIVTAATGNVMLAFAALLLGVIVGLERRASGGVLAPILTHLAWSVTMLYALPALL